VSVLGSQQLGVAVSSDKPISVDISSVEIAYLGGIGMADENPIIYEDGSNYIIDGEAYFTGSRKGWATAGFETADMSVVALYSRHLLTGKITSRGIIWVRRDSRVEGDFSAGLTYHRAENKWYFTTPVLGHMKGTGNFANDLQMELATLDSSPIDRLTVIDNPPKVVINGEVPHDPTGLVYFNGYYYMGYGHQEGPIRPRLARSRDRVNWEVVMTNQTIDAEGYKFFLYQGVLFLFAAQQQGNQFHFWQVDASGVTYKDFLVNPLPQYQAQHAAFYLRPSDGAIILGGMTTDAAARWPSSLDLYTNGDVRLFIANGALNYYTTDSNSAGIGTATTSDTGGGGTTTPPQSGTRAVSISGVSGPGNGVYNTVLSFILDAASTQNTVVHFKVTGEPGSNGATVSRTVTIPAGNTVLNTQGYYNRSYLVDTVVTVTLDSDSAYVVGSSNTVTYSIPKDPKPVYSLAMSDGGPMGGQIGW
jgi:hypothetical protein